jgi:uncharacterized membrane protein
VFEPANLLKLAHALAGVLLVAGLVGRWLTVGHAARVKDIPALQQVLAVSARFERIVMVSSLVVLGLGIATAIAQGRPFLGPLQGAPLDWLFVSLVLYLSVLPLIPLVFLPRAKVFDAALADAEAGGVVTERLARAFSDPVVFAAHVYELAAIVVVLGLMIAKPF